MANRLDLNWKLEWRDERVQFVTQYLDKIQWKPKEDELEMMGKYILWGKDRETGLNGRQEGLDLSTRSGTWDSKQFESLDALMETPGFNEASLLQLGTVPTRQPKEVFSRAQARKNAPPAILANLEALWHTIDSLDYTISYYDLYHNRRTTPIRQQLIDRIPEDERARLEAIATHLSLYP